MRRFNFDNLKGLNVDKIDLFSPFAEVMSFISGLNLSFAAPQPSPLFAEISGTSGNDTLNGTADDDTINGLAGDDVINGGEGNDALHGGNGVDTAIYSSDQTRDYTVTEVAPGEYTVEAIGGTGEGTDTLTGVETIRVGGINGTDYAIGAMASGLGTGTETISLSYPFSGADGTPIIVELRGTDFDNVGTLYVSSGTFGASYDILYVSMNAYQLRDLHTISMGVLETFDVYFTGVTDTLDLTYVQVPSRTAIFGTSADETVIVNDDVGIEFYGGAGSDTLILSYDSSQFWTFRTYENPNDVGIDTADFSNLGLVDDGAGGTLGELTFDLTNSRVTQTGLSLSTDSYAVIDEYDKFIGWDGEDVFIGDDVNNIFIGNAGNDTAVYSSSDAADYNILEFAPGEYYVESLGTGEGIDTLTGVETIRLGGVNGTDYAIGDLAVGSESTTVLTLGDDVYTVAETGDDFVFALSGDDQILIYTLALPSPTLVFGGEGNDTLLVIGENYGQMNALGGTFNFTTGEVSHPYQNIAFSGFEALDFLGGGFTDTVTGAGGNDILHGGNVWENHLIDGTIESYFAGDFLYGMGGDDILNGGGGNNLLDGGDGNDLLFGGADWTGQSGSNDTIIGGDGLDTAVYQSADIADYILTETAPGEYTIEAIGGTGEGLDTLTGVEFIRLGGFNGSDYAIDGDFTTAIINLTAGDDDYTGTSAAEVINGLAGDDIINGGSGDDTLNGHEGDDTLFGGAGRDILNGGAGADAFDGGTSDDTVTYALETVGATVDLLNDAASTGSALGDTFVSVENLIGSDLRDVLRGSNFDNMITGGGGDDVLQGRNGDDIILGGDGDDSLNGGNDADILIGGAGDDILAGSTGTDVAVYGSANTADYLVRETGRLEYSVIALNGQDEGTDVLTSIETIRLGGINGTDYAIADLAALWRTDLTSGNDDYTGTEQPDTVYGFEGDDIIRGLGGEDYLYGGAGKDTLIGGEDANYLDGGEGVDTASYVGTAQRVLIDLYLNVTSSGAAGDVLVSIENLIGTAFNDIFRGDDEDNYFSGEDGADTVDGRWGDDALIGGLGDDVLRGGFGDDIIFGGEGDDSIDGGGDTSDVAVYESANTGDYIVTETAPGEYTVEAIGGTGEGTDTLVGIETIRLGGLDGTDYDISNLLPGSGTNLTNGDDAYATIMDGEEVFALDGNDIIDIKHDDVIVFGGNGDDVMRIDDNQNFVTVRTDFDGGDGYDTAKFVFLQTIGLDTFASLDVRNMTFTAVEALEAVFELNPDDPGDGGSGGEIIYDFLKINADQISMISYLDVPAALEIEVYFNEADAGVDFRGLESENSNTVLLYSFADVDRDFYLSGVNILEGYLAGGEDTIFVTYDPTKTWRATFLEWEANNGGNDVLDFSLMDTVSDGMGGTLGLLTHTMTRVTQTGLGLASDSWINVSNIDEYYGWDGEDIFIGDARDNIFDGNGGTDTAVYSSANAADYNIIEIATGVYSIAAIGGTGEGIDTLTNIETIRLGGINGTDYDIASLVTNGGPINLTNGADDYTGTSASETINGLDGDDIIRGEGGDDIINGGAGADTLDGGDGNDTVSYITELSGALINLRAGAPAGSAAGDILTSFENAIGSNFDDVISGDFGANVLRGEGGNDTLNGERGEDTLFGGDGDDSLNGGAGADVLNGGTGSDTASYQLLASQGLTVSLGDTSLNTGDAVGDSYISVENLFGTFFQDVLYGDGQDNIISGYIGNDTLFGGDGDDTLEGGDGDDILNGEAGDDMFFIENGSDTYDGGSGFDTVDYSASAGQRVSVDLFLGTTGFLAANDTLISIENIIGAHLADTLRGDNSENVFSGLQGNDVIDGRGGNDTLLGGSGDDYLKGGFGDDVIFGGEGDDSILGDGGSDIAIYSSSAASDYTFTETAPGEYTVETVGGTGEGTDTLIGIETIRLGGINGTDYDIAALAGAGEIFLTIGDDVYSGTAVDETINALDGNDVFDGGAGINTLNGDGGNDVITSLGDDTINGGTGNDTVEMGENVFNADTMTDGGADIDTISFSTLAQLPSGNLFLVLDLEGQAYSVRDGGTVLYVDQFSSFENATGSEHRDLLQGDSTANTLLGLGGNDTLQGRGGDDILNGGSGDNTLQGGDGQDQIFSLGNDIIDAGAGNDFVEIGESVMDSATAIAGGSGIDTLSLTRYVGNTAAINFIVVDLQSQAFSIREDGAIIHVEQISGFENATGTDYTDLLQGDGAANWLMGLGGNDTLQGRAGDDTLLGGDGDDILEGGAGADSLDGGLGTDIASYASAASAIVFDGLGLVTASGDIVDDTLISIEAISGSAFDDRLFGANDASIFYGGAGADRLFGRNGDDELYGEDGDDIILGGRDNDIIDGGAGNDQLRGNEGDDTLLGGDGNDVLAGGAGADAMDGGAGIDRVEYTYGTNAGVTASLGDASINTGDAAGDTYINIENLYGTTFDDALFGDAGNNRIDGRLGNDMLFGGEGNDYLIGGAGDDVLNGEAGNDLLLGQAGADIYQFDAAHGTDRIVVFTQGEDLIEFTEGVFDFSGLTITQDGAHVNIDTGEGAIIVNNSLVADFASDDFIFVPPPAQEPLDMMEQDMAIFVEVDALI